MSKGIVPPMARREFVDNHDFLCQWCCKCGNRHIWHFTIHRGKKAEDDFIEITGFQDDVASKLRRFWEKQHKQKKT